MPRKKKAKGTVNVNFKGVESRRTPEEGDYKCRVLEAVAGKSSNNNEQIEIVAEIASGEYKGQKLYLYCPLLEDSLWKLHAFLTALGIDVPDDDMDLDLSDLVDEEFMGVITHETYNGKKRAKLTDFDSLANYSGDDDEDEDDEDEDEAPKKAKKSKSKKSKSKKSKSEDEDEDDEDEEEDEAPKKGKKSKGGKKASKKSKAADEDDDDEDEEDEAPKKSKSKKSKKKSKKKLYDRDEVEDMDEDELEELLEEAGLEDEVDLDDYKKLPKKVAAVIEALEEAELLDD